MNDFFIDPRSSLSLEVVQEILKNYGLGLYVSPRGDVDHNGKDFVYGVYVNDYEFVENYHRSGGTWGYMLVDEWCDLHRLHFSA